MSRGDLNPTEPHPAAQNALDYMKTLGLQDLTMWQESFSSCAIEGNRLAEICGETLNRLLTGQPISDRYLLGLAWTIKSMSEMKEGGHEDCKAGARCKGHKRDQGNKGSERNPGRKRKVASRGKRN